MGGRSVDVKRSDIWFGLKQVFQHFMDLGILLLVVAVGILYAVPEAQAQNRVGSVSETRTVSSTKPRCFFNGGTTFSLMVFANSLGFA